MKLLVVNGPNLNMLGIREPEVYGSASYADLVAFIQQTAIQEKVETVVKQSNHEGAIVDMIQEAYGNMQGIIINPAAYTHTSIAILDALKAVALPAVEVHLSNIYVRDSFRHQSFAGLACLKTFMGLGWEGYRQAIIFLKNYINERF